MVLYKKIIVMISIIFIMLIGSLGYVLYSVFFSIDKLPEGSLIQSSDSPDNLYTLNMYLVSGLTTGNSLRGELLQNETRRKKNIYWNRHESQAVVYWLSNSKVVINGFELNVINDVYDWRREN